MYLLPSYVAVCVCGGVCAQVTWIWRVLYRHSCLDVHFLFKFLLFCTFWAVCSASNVFLWSSVNRCVCLQCFLVYVEGFLATIVFNCRLFPPAPPSHSCRTRRVLWAWAMWQGSSTSWSEAWAWPCSWHWWNSATSPGPSRAEWRCPLHEPLLPQLLRPFTAQP